MLSESRLNQIHDELRRELQDLLQARDQDEKVLKQIALVNGVLQSLHKYKTFIGKL
jgi:hypothetical protein